MKPGSVGRLHHLELFGFGGTNASIVLERAHP